MQKLALALIAGCAATLAFAPATEARTKTKAAAAPACAAVSEADVKAQFDRFNAAWATLNPDQVTQLFTKDAVLLPTVSDIKRSDHAGIRDYFVTFLQGRPVGRVTESTIDIGCNKATRVGNWTVTLTDAATGQTSDVKARFSFVYRYEQGDWKIDHLHSSLLPARAGR